MDIKQVLSDLRAERERIDKAIIALEQLDGAPSQATAKRGRPATQTATAAAQPKRGRRKMSAAARKAISEAAKKRWAERKGSKPQASAKRAAPTHTAPKPGGISAAGRKRISMMMKKRWAEKKKAAKAKATAA